MSNYDYPAPYTIRQVSLIGDLDKIKIIINAISRTITYSFRIVAYDPSIVGG